MKKNESIKGIIYYFGHILTGIINDVLMKYLSKSISFWQIIFIRVSIGTLLLLPIILQHNKKILKTNFIKIHIIRGFLLFVSINLWVYGLSKLNISIATTIDFTVPIFVLILAPIFLKEKVTKNLWMVTIMSFIGIIIALSPIRQDISYHGFSFLFAAFIFAVLDIINKKYVSQESILSLVFYSTLFATFFSFFPAIYSWKRLLYSEIIIFLILAIAGNLLIFLLLKALSLVNVSSLAPYRYFEYIVSIIVGFCVFGDLPTKYNLVGAIIILSCSIYILYNHKTKK